MVCLFPLDIIGGNVDVLMGNRGDSLMLWFVRLFASNSLYVLNCCGSVLVSCKMYRCLKP